MKKVVLFVLSCILFTMVSCSKYEAEPDPVKLNVIHQTLTSIDYGSISSSISFESELVGDTLRCKVRTVFVGKNDSLLTINSQIQKEKLLIFINTNPEYYKPDFFFPLDSLDAAYLISFDLLEMNSKEYDVTVVVNNLYTALEIL